MRVIAGLYKGRRLVSFQASHIRPTTDRVKESLFNMLMHDIEGARVLDLFSGTGNLAIECLSRGAAFVDIVENHKKSLQIIRENLSILKITTGFKIHPLDAFRYIAAFQGEAYDLVLADPPFTRSWADQLGQAVGASRLLHADSKFVMESSTAETVADEYPGLKRLDRRHFGDKNLEFFGKSVDE
ncbi:MAG: 16S rRNA (guanine(966)-N(2))-methyltransferase RsmD [Bdellovibrionales bacterium]